MMSGTNDNVRESLFMILFYPCFMAVSLFKLILFAINQDFNTKHHTWVNMVKVNKCVTCHDCMVSIVLILHCAEVM